MNMAKTPPATQTLNNPSESDTHLFPCQSPGDSLSDPSAEEVRRCDKRESNRAWVAEQERRIKREVVGTICCGKTESLKPNSGEAIAVGGHYICVYFRDGLRPTYRVWKWHGHVTILDANNGLSLEHICGNYFENVESLTPPPPPPSETQTLTLNNPSQSDTHHPNFLSDPSKDRHCGKRESNGAWVAEQERRIEREVTRTICSGNTDSLKPNSGEAITVGKHCICVSFHDGLYPSYRAWQWDGHVMTYDANSGLRLEHVYGNYLENVDVPSRSKEGDETKTERNVSL